MEIKHNILYFFLLVCGLVMHACALIDDDLSDCGSEAEITYQVKLVTTLDVELTTVLDLDTDVYALNTMRNYFNHIFVDYVHDVDLSFYSAFTNQRAYHEQHIIDASEKSFTLYLRSDNYKHLSACNLEEALNVSLVGDIDPETMQLQQMETDTLNPHTTGLFTARLDMDVDNNVSQNFVVPLFMANSGIGMVVDTIGSGVKGVKVYALDFATDFFIRDSVYLFRSSPVVKFDNLPLNLSAAKPAIESEGFEEEIGEHIEQRVAQNVDEGTRRMVFTAACFPSRNETLIADGNIYAWRAIVEVETAEGKTARNELFIRTPLRASTLRVLKLRLNSDGKATVLANDVGASVDLDWHQGGVYNPEL